MEIALAIVIFFTSLFFVVKGGDIIVVAANSICRKFNLSKVAFGATVVSFLTTLPELVIAVLSSVDGTTGLAVGNSIGSVICNTCLVLGIGFVCGTAAFKKGISKLVMYLLISIVVMVFCLFGYIQIWQAFVLIALSVVFFVINFMSGKTDNSTQEIQEDIAIQPMWVSIVMFVLGTVLVGFGSYHLVEKASFLATKIGISEQFIGLSVLALGTSIPEIVTMISSLRQKSLTMAVGNIIGANILNLTLILGTTRLSGWSHTMAVSQETIFVMIPFVLLLTLILVVPILIKKRTFKTQGIIFLVLGSLYFAYLIVSIIVPIWR